MPCVRHVRSVRPGNIERGREAVEDWPSTLAWHFGLDRAEPVQLQRAFGHQSPQRFFSAVLGGFAGVLRKFLGLKEEK